MRIKRNPMSLVLVGCIFALISSVCLSLSETPKKQVSVDLLNASVNGQPILTLSLDQVLDLLGRPDEVSPKQLIPIGSRYIKSGPTLWYFQEGISVEFRYADNDEEQKMIQVTFFLAKESIRAGTFQPFSGTITKDISGQWRVPEFLKAFSEYSASDKFDEQHAEKWRSLEAQLQQYQQDSGQEKDSSDSLNLKAVTASTARIELSFDAFNICVRYNPTTKYLESVQIQAKADKTE